MTHQVEIMHIAALLATHHYSDELCLIAGQMLWLRRFAL